MAQTAEQHEAIARLHATYRSRFRWIRGIEANIGTDGSLDLSAEETKQFELVLAAPHSKLRKADDQTERLTTAIQNRDVHVLAHTRGRIAGTRAGIVADWNTVFTRAAHEGVAIEIDGDPARQDLDYAISGGLSVRGEWRGDELLRCCEWHRSCSASRRLRDFAICGIPSAPPS